MANNQLPSPNLPPAKTAAASGGTNPISPASQKASPHSSTLPNSNLASNVTGKIPAGLDRQAPAGSPPGSAGGNAAATAAKSSSSNSGFNPLQPPKPPQAKVPKANSNTAAPGSVGNVAGPKLSGPQLGLPGKTSLPGKPGLPGSPTATGSTPPQPLQPSQPQAARPQIQTRPPSQNQSQASSALPPSSNQQQGNKALTSSPSIKSPDSGPVFAQAKKSPLKLIPLVLGGVALIGALVFAATRFLSNDSSSVSDSDGPAVSQGQNSGSGSAGNSAGSAASGQQVTLTYWGLWEPSSVLEEVLTEFEQQNPGIKVEYRKQSHKDYRERLQTAVASGNGPDVFRFHATWVPMLQEELATMPSKIMSANQYKTTFYPVANEQLQLNGQIVGLPLMYDGLALFYNKEYLKTAGREVPKSWAELRDLANKLSVPATQSERASGEIKRAGLAIGNATNVDHFSDILGLLILQNGGDPGKPLTSEVRDALKFYTNFALNDHVFSESLPNSTMAFARGDAAMMFGPSWRVHDVKNINPDLDFGVAPAPKLSDAKIAWASYWAEGVSSKSKNQTESWKLLQFLTSKETLKKLYSAQSKIRTFGEIYSRQDLAQSISDELVAAYLLDAPRAQSWYMCSLTHDNGLNDQIIKYYQDAVNAVIQGKDIEQVLQTLSAGVNQVLKQYNAQ